MDPLGFVDTKTYPDRLAAAPRGDRHPRRGDLGHRAASRARASRSASWTSRSWAARWARSSARRSRAPPKRHCDERLPLIVVSASGGARMQEGTLALMQLAKTGRRARTAARRRRPVHQRDDRPDDRRRLRLVRGARRHQPRRAAVRSSASPARGSRRGPPAMRCRMASSGPNSCSRTASSTRSSLGWSCAIGSPRCSPTSGPLSFRPTRRARSTAA